jgi:hypothetical protein
MTHEIGRPARVRATIWLSVVACVGLGAFACSSGDKDGPFDSGFGGGAIDVGSRGGQGGSTTSSGSSGRSSTGSVGPGGGGIVNTSTGGSGTVVGTACDNGKDDDGDGLVDGLDPECTGPMDNAEDSFATGIPGDNRDPKWQDCFFDGNSGAGDDGCRYHTDCLYGTLPASDPDCRLTTQCVDFCRPLTPNGCDCFGCCSVQRSDGSSVDILESASCSLAKIDDPAACPRCTKSTECGNTCGTCELCPGKTAEDLPKSCTPTSTGGAGGATGAGGRGGAGGTGGTGGTPNHVCDNGEQVCGTGLPACPSDQYCSLGCCIVAVR